MTTLPLLKTISLRQIPNTNLYGSLKGAWERRFSYKQALSVWRRFSRGSFLSPPDYNSKLVKGQAHGWQTISLSLAPSDISGIDVCPFKTEECAASCIGHSAGNAGRYPAVLKARIMRTRFLFTYPEAAMGLMAHELLSLRVKLGMRAKIAFRMNAFSDIVHESLNPGLLMYAQSLGIQLYDYTKVSPRMLRPFTGYDLTLSYSGENWDECVDTLNNNGRVSMVFIGTPPKVYNGFTVVNGDRHDLRFLDPKGVIVGLSLKGVSPLTAGKFAVKESCHMNA